MNDRLAPVESITDQYLIADIAFDLPQARIVSQFSEDIAVEVKVKDRNFVPGREQLRYQLLPT